MTELMQQWLRDRRGVTAIEFGVVAVLVGCFAVTCFAIVGNAIYSTMMAVAAQLG